MDTQTWQDTGKRVNGQAVYQNVETGEYNIERDHRRLCIPSKEEIAAIMGGDSNGEQKRDTDTVG